MRESTRRDPFVFLGGTLTTERPGHLAYQPALDGLRAVAVAAVIAYHLGYPWARGGYLGVDTFFVLSGYLITSLLLTEARAEGRIDLPTFWVRRARRLLPALLLVLAAIAIYGAWSTPTDAQAALRADGLFALFYSANWHFIADNNSYFDLFAAPSLLEHTWSLAIEEQFYLVWPLVVAACLRIGRGRRTVVVVVATCAALGSAALMATLADDATRAYFGTDTRVHSLLIGALLAVLLARRANVQSSRPVSYAGVLALGAVVIAYATIGDGESFMYRGGFLLFAVTVAAVIAAAVHPTGPVRRLLSLAVLVWIGRISYGLYLWHWPVQLIVDSERTGISGVPLDLVRVGLTVALAAASYYLVELPIRSGATLRGRVALPSAVAGVAAVAVALVVATASATSPSPAFAAPSPGATITVKPPSLVPSTTTIAPSRLGAPPPMLAASAATNQPSAPRVIGIVGDSVAASLLPGLEREAAARGIGLASAAIAGCGAAGGVLLDDEGQPFAWADDCARAVPIVQNEIITKYRPEVVLWLSTWETQDRLVGEARLRFRTPEGDRELLREMEATLTRVTAQGARVVVLIPPPPVMGRNGPPDEDVLQKRAHLNGLIALFAYLHADRVEVVDFAAIVCPNGVPCPTEMDGMRLRPDGGHFTNETSAWAASRLLAAVLDAA
jgi:peptidoglycan/LPS O-acetylase OafA/YrhL